MNFDNRPSRSPNALDFAKGIAILTVVTGHAIQYSDPDFDTSYLFRVIYAAHMPLFMFISGMLFRQPLTAEMTQKQIGARARSLLVPFLAWLLLSYLAITFIQQPAGFPTSFPSFLVEVVHHPDAGGLWFLLVLFECHVLLASSYLAVGQKAALASVGIILLLNIFLTIAPQANYLGLGLLRWHYLFFIAGHLIAKRDFSIDPKWRWLTLIVYAGLVCFWYRSSYAAISPLVQHLAGGIQRIAYQLAHAIVAFCGIAAALQWCKHLEVSTYELPKSALNYLGKRSLEIYVGHYVFIYMAVRYIDFLAIPLALRQLIIVVFALAGALTLRGILRRSGFLRGMLYGR